MSVITVTRETIRNAVLGGCVLGGGGGGSMADGLQLAEEALRLGEVRIASLDELSKDDLVVTASAVGAPSTVEPGGIPVSSYRDSMEKFIEYYGKAPAGVISCENGGLASVNGWIQAAAVGVLVVDAPANGRAHPIGLMGSMGLEDVEGYESHQMIIAGGGKNPKVEAYLRGDLEAVTASVRAVASVVPGLAANVRNPVTPEYLMGHAAAGALTQAIEVGRAMNSVGDATARISAAASRLRGEIIASGVVVEKRIWVQDGYDYGMLTVQEDGGRTWRLPFWNEYLGAESEGVYSALFPDLTMTFDVGSGNPLPSSAVMEGVRVAVLTVPSDGLILGAGSLPGKVAEVVSQALSNIASKTDGDGSG